MSEVYYNTTELHGEAIKMAIASARTQEEKVEAYFRVHPPGHAAGAWRVHKAVFGETSPTPPTSTRRAMSNLKKSDVLEKLDEFEDGLYGFREHKYRLKTQGQMGLPL